MADKGFKISVLLEAIDKMSKPIGKIASKFGPFARKIGSNLETIKKKADAVNKVTGAWLKKLVFWSSAAAAAISALIIRSTSVADKLAKTADKLGITTRQLQIYRYGAESSGIATNTLDMAIQRFTRRMADARKGMGEGVKGLDALDISLEHANGKYKTTDELLREVADRMMGVEDQSERVAIAFKFFDSEGVGMVNMLRDGSKGLDVFERRMKKLGIIDEDTARAGEKVTQSLYDIRLQISNLVTNLVGKYSPIIHKTIEGMINWIDANRDLIKSTIILWIKRLAAVAEGFLEGLKGIVEWTKKWFGWIGDLLPDLKDTSDEMERWKNIGDALSKVLTAIIGLKVAVWITNIGKALGGIKGVLKGSLIFVLLDAILAVYNTIKETIELWDKMDRKGAGWLEKIMGLGIKAGKFSPSDPLKGFWEKMDEAAEKAYGKKQTGESIARHEAKVLIDFQNAPVGMRVLQTISDDEFDVEIGPSQYGYA